MRPLQPFQNQVRKMVEHTPTPWKIITEDISLIESVALAPDGHSYIVAHCLDGATSQIDEETRDANAALIVAAVNSYAATSARIAALEGACEAALDYIYDIADKDENPDEWDLTKQLRAALASTDSMKGE